MLNDEIKEILRSIPAVLVVEDGRPAYVITQYDAWRSYAQGGEIRISNGSPGNFAPRASTGAKDPQETQVLERLNKEILSLREQIQMAEAEVAEAGEND